MLSTARKLRLFHKDVSGQLVVATSTDDTTLFTVRNASHTIYLQKVVITITEASAGKTWQIVDSNGTPRQLAGPVPTDADGTQFTYNFGDEGVPLTAGKNLVLDVSATGAAGLVAWEGYQKLTSVVAAASA